MRAPCVTTAVTIAAIILFIVTGSAALVTLQDHADVGTGIIACLNAALILTGWSRSRTLARNHAASTNAELRADTIAHQDLLTGLCNRRGFLAAGADMIEDMHRRGRCVGLILLDIDRFRLVRDTHGPAVGDALLRAVASEIAQAMPEAAIAGRLHGEEFACAFPVDASDPTFTDTVAEAIGVRLAREFAVEELKLTVATSIGMARSGGECATMDALLAEAHTAMCAARKAGRNRRMWFSKAMELDLRSRETLEHDLRGAIAAGQIVPFFEQQVDLATDRLTGFEVLARWNHPTRGLIMPEQFIGIAEDAGLIGELSLCVMRQAFAAARDWDRSLSLSINLSPQQLRDPWLAQKIIKLLVEYGFSASRTEIEITERSLFENLPLAQSIAVSLKNQGVGLVLDDFGAGYSSLAHLRALPFDRIKIDRSFVLGMATNVENEAIVTTIVGLGESLGIPVTAEGIEEEVVVARLAAMGCARGQGYIFGRPTDAASTRRLLAERRLLAIAGAPSDVIALHHLRAR